jgi:hypothetical protein
MARVRREVQMEVAPVDAATGERRVVLPRRAVGVHVVPGFVVQRQGERVLRQVPLPVRDEQPVVPKEVDPEPAELRAEVEVHLLAVPLPADAPSLDLRLERDLGRERLARAAARLVPRQRRGPHAHLGEDRRPGVVGLELADLPLLAQHPERVAHLRLQRAIEVVSARPALEPVPHGDRRERPLLERGLQIGDHVSLVHAQLPIRS